MIVQQYTLDLVPDPTKPPVVIGCSQYDKNSRTIEFGVCNRGMPQEIESDCTITVRGTKQDGTGFEYICYYEGSSIYFDIEEQMTIFPGVVPCEIRIVHGEEVLGSMNFKLLVEKSSLDEETVISETELNGYEELLKEIQEQEIARITPTPEDIQEDVDNWLEDNQSGIGTLSYEAKLALLDLLRKAVYNKEDCNVAYNRLNVALFTGGSVQSITAVFTQGSMVVYQNTPLDMLKQNLVVTANWSTGETTPIEDDDYILTGTLEVGTSTVTVTYSDVTTTFTVVVSQGTYYELLHAWDFTQSYIDSVGSLVATPYGCTRDENGVHFTAGGNVLYLGQIYSRDKIFEIDISNFEFAGNSDYHIRLLMGIAGSASNAVGAGALIFRSGYNWTSYGYKDSNTSHTGSSYRKWSESTWNIPNADTDYFDGKTVKIYLSNDMHTKRLYVDDVLMGTINDIYFNGDRCSHAYIGGTMGRTAANGDQCYNMTITAIRVYSAGEG